MQREITERITLHDDKGYITKEGWAKKPYWQYDRNKIKVNKLKIKEWDYYAVVSQKNGFGLSFTISDMGYIGFSSITFFNFDNKYYNSVDSLFLFPAGKLKLSLSSDQGFIKYEDKKLRIEILTEKVSGNNIEKKIKFRTSNLLDYHKNKGIEGELKFVCSLEDDSICIATSWKENRRAFYYNQKINCMRVEGKFNIGEKFYKFNPNYDLAVLDWGKVVWTYKNRWYWSSLFTFIDGVRFGWNLGYGFSDRSPASENALFYDRKNYKLDMVDFDMSQIIILSHGKF